MLKWLDNFWDGFERGVLSVALGTITVGLVVLGIKSVIDFVGVFI